MSKHTPGPWRAVFEGKIGHFHVVTEARGHSVRTVVSGVRERDAFLIAAAPELLEALENIERTAGLPAMDDDPVRVRAREVIRRAKGEIG